jgi:vacuolar-type H+-ATPase subunit E/Vma4
MPESIESFVKKLQDEGVSAGKEAAEKIKNEAKLEADNIIADAKARADQILDKAKNDSGRQFFRMQTELELAVRDAILKLRETAGKVVSTMLTQKIEKKFSDPNYLGQIIREVIIAYAKADAAQQPFMEVNISRKMNDRLNEGILKNLFQNISQEHEKVALQATLSKAGFEYKIHGATVEVSPDSVSELISEMVSPALQVILDKFIGEKSEKDPNENGSNESEKNLKGRNGSDDKIHFT